MIQWYVTEPYVASSQRGLVWPSQRAVGDCCELQKTFSAVQYVTGEAQQCIMIPGRLAEGCCRAVNS